jgi:hypothetical protein
LIPIFVTDQTVSKEGVCMVPSSVRLGDVLELVVVVFQVLGVGGLFLWRIWPTTRWGGRGRASLIVALLGLGIAGALCGRHDSEFALFAGGTMTALLIGITTGSGRPPITALPPTAEARLAS